ncbi:small conductance mechanosensitive channel [Dongia mobilis]|uniref:Small conductance mechanosensitive channel n=1 Tax=Dongia mobilis TaxID=578943 RepID=A0A4R6WLW3_9PROT|nr:mechanosensitive ion channel domain-containing protein [Dongia mobilis]TDQ81566.1 small conductance mechanosensitive channel [Dongia mobilis]
MHAPNPRRPAVILISAVLLMLSGLGMPMLGAAPATAQTIPGMTPVDTGTAEAPAQDPAADTQQLIDSLKDPEKRELLLRQLELLKAAQELEQSASGSGNSAPPEEQPASADETLAEKLSGWTGQTVAPSGESVPLPGSGTLVALDGMVGEIRSNLEESWRWVGGLADEIGQLDQIAHSPKFRAFWASLSWELLVILVGASLVGAFAHFLLRRPVQRLLGHARTVTRLVWRSALGVVLKLLPAVLFGLTGYALVIAFDLGATPSIVAMALINAQTAVLLIMAVGGLDIAAARGRIMPDWFTDEAANFLRASVLHLAITLSYGVMMIELAGAMGVDEALIRLLVHIVGFVTIVIALYTIYRLRRILALHDQVQAAQEIEALAAGADNAAAALATRSLAKAENSLRRNWSSFATLGVLGFYLLWMMAPVALLLFALRGAILSILLIILLRVVVRLIKRAFKRYFADEGRLGWWHSGPWHRVQIYLDILRRAVVALLTVLVAILLLQIWGVDFLAWLTAPIGQRIVGSVMTIGLFVIGGIVLSELFSIAVESHLQKRSADYSDLSRRSRARTLLPLLRNVVRVTLGTIITLLILGEIGIEIGPLLAAAGVVGLAVGFGAQTLVKDIITGIFILVEDTIAVGDVVDLEGNSGVVESMTIRTVRLRDQAGTVHTVPFSAITKVMNMTRDFSYAVFDISIAYDQDIRQVMEVIQAVAADLRKDPRLSRDILEPIEILGVDRFADSAVIIKARIKTKPIRQWEVGRTFNWRLKEAFDAAGIEIPFPQRTMHIVQPKKGRDDAAPSDALSPGAEPPLSEA